MEDWDTRAEVIRPGVHTIEPLNHLPANLSMPAGSNLVSVNGTKVIYVDVLGHFHLYDLVAQQYEDMPQPESGRVIPFGDAFSHLG